MEEKTLTSGFSAGEYFSWPAQNYGVFAMEKSGWYPIIYLRRSNAGIANGKKVTKMENNLTKILFRISEDYKDNIQKDSRHYLEVNIFQKASELGLSEVGQYYRDVYAIVPLKRPVRGMKVRIDGRTFVNYAQFESGIVIPRQIAQHVQLPYENYVAKDSMICNFSQNFS
jgi:hypothetical protein